MGKSRRFRVETLGTYSGSFRFGEPGIRHHSQRERTKPEAPNSLAFLLVERIKSLDELNAIIATFPGSVPNRVSTYTRPLSHLWHRNLPSRNIDTFVRRSALWQRAKLAGRIMPVAHCPQSTPTRRTQRNNGSGQADDCRRIQGRAAGSKRIVVGRQLLLSTPIHSAHTEQ